MFRKTVLIMLLACAVLFPHYDYGGTTQTVEVGDQFQVVYVVPFENVSASFNETGSGELETGNTETVPRQQMNVSLYVDCAGVHVHASANQDPVEGAEISVYRIPKDPLVIFISGKTDTNGSFIFNTSESRIGLTVSKKGYKYHESIYDIQVLNCTVPKKNGTENPEPETGNRTPATENREQGTNNRTPGTEPQENKTAGVTGTPPVVQQPGIQSPEPSAGLGDLLLGLLVIAAAVAAYLVFGRGKISVDPMPLPKPAEKEGNVSVDPMPLPKPSGKGGDVSVDPMPLPKPGKGNASIDPKKKKSVKSVDPMPLP